MRIQVTIPDGAFADALVTEAARRNQSPASLPVSFGRTMLNKYRYKIPLQSTIRKRGYIIAGSNGSDSLHVRAEATQANSLGKSGGKNG